MYFVHPSTDMSVDISTDSQPMNRSTYRSSISRYGDRHIGRESVDMSTEMCRSTYRPTVEHRSMCRPALDRYVGRYVDRVWLSDCRPTCRLIGYRHSADIQLPLELYLTFSDLNNKLFTDTDGKGRHSWKSLAINCNIFHVVCLFKLFHV